MTQFKSPENQANAMFQRAGVITEGHFISAKGLHLPEYVQKDKTITDPELLNDITRLMADKVAEQFTEGDIDALVGIAPCSSQLATSTALHLGANHWSYTPSSYFAEKSPSISQAPESVPIISTDIVFKRGFDKALEGKKVLLVEDVLTTGYSLIKLREAASKIAGLHIVGALAEFNRAPSRNTAESLGLLKLITLISRDMPDYTTEQCPQWLLDIPVNTDLGHGAQYLERQQPRS